MRDLSELREIVNKTGGRKESGEAEKRSPSASAKKKKRLPRNTEKKTGAEVTGETMQRILARVSSPGYKNA